MCEVLCEMSLNTIGCVKFSCYILLGLKWGQCIGPPTCAKIRHFFFSVDDRGQRESKPRLLGHRL